MSDNMKALLKKRLTKENYNRLIAMKNPKLYSFVADAIELTNPDSVFVCTDSAEDIAYIRELAIKTGEEFKLAYEIQIPPSAEVKKYSGWTIIFRIPKVF